MELTVKEANKKFHVGARVKFYPISGEETYEDTVVRSESWALGHGEVVLKVHGRAGGVAVSHLVLK